MRPPEVVPVLPNVSEVLTVSEMASPAVTRMCPLLSAPLGTESW